MVCKDNSQQVRNAEKTEIEKKGSLYVEKMVGKRGFEPPTPASRTLCSTRLSHFPTIIS